MDTHTLNNLKIGELRDICRYVKAKKYSTLKKQDLIKKIVDEDIYDTYILYKKSEHAKAVYISSLKEEREINLNVFYESTNNTDIEINEDESDSDDSVCESDFENNIENDLLFYGDYIEKYREFNKLENNENNEDTKNEDIKNYLINNFEDVNTENYKFGNSFQFSSNRSHSRYFIGKNNTIIYNPMYGDGDLVISYELTKYTKDAVNDFKDSEFDSILLRYDDKFIKENIVGNILKKWNWKFIYDTMENGISIEFPNNKEKVFNLGTNVKDIMSYFKKSNEVQTEFIINLEYENNYYGYIHDTVLPFTWNCERLGGGGNGTSGYFSIKYIGPLSEKEHMITLLKKTYDKEEFTYKIC